VGSGKTNGGERKTQTTVKRKLATTK